MVDGSYKFCICCLLAAFVVESRFATVEPSRVFACYCGRLSGKRIYIAIAPPSADYKTSRCELIFQELGEFDGTTHYTGRVQGNDIGTFDCYFLQYQPQPGPIA
jgi:hypothetical protein